jgi:hypothetical protein
MAAKEPDRELLALLADHDPAVRARALALRSLVVEEAPTATEIVYDAGYAVSIAFSFTERWQDGFCMVVVYTKHVNLGFHRGAELLDPARRLKGTGKKMRHIKIKTDEDLTTQDDLREFVRRAIALAIAPGPGGAAGRHVPASGAPGRRSS